VLAVAAVILVIVAWKIQGSTSNKVDGGMQHQMERYMQFELQEGKV
jgi:hypothetical protein